VDVKLTLPYPPSANKYRRNSLGATVASAEARYYKNEVACLAKRAGIEQPNGPVVLFVNIYRPMRSGDLDNRLKLLIDALEGVAFSDDEQVIEIHARRFDDKKNPRAKLEVRAATQRSPWTGTPAGCGQIWGGACDTTASTGRPSQGSGLVSKASGPGS
jgi:crossover junction endodeoxyribonuclease RusA